MWLDVGFQYVNVKRKAQGDQDDYGHPDITWSAPEALQNIKCDIQPASIQRGSLKELIQGLEEEAKYVIFFLKDTAVLVGDTVEADDDGDEAYSLTAVYDWDTQVLGMAKKL